MGFADTEIQDLAAAALPREPCAEGWVGHWESGLRCGTGLVSGEFEALWQRAKGDV